MQKLLWVLLLGLPGLLQAAEVPGRTTITSETMEMQGTESRNYFYFRNDVVVLGTNLELRCDMLTVVSARGGDQTAMVGEIGAIESIVAVGNVYVHQAGRSAYAGKAEVNPAAGTVVLSDSPRIVDGEVEVEGYQFVLHRGEKKFESIPDPNAPAGQPSRSVVRLGALPDLGFDQKEEDIKQRELELESEPERELELEPEGELEAEGEER